MTKLVSVASKTPTKYRWYYTFEINTTLMKTLSKDQDQGDHAVGDQPFVLGPTVKLGFLHQMFNKCLPSNTAVFMFILVTLCLSASDAGSDMALSYFLYTR